MSTQFDRGRTSRPLHFDTQLLTRRCSGRGQMDSYVHPVVRNITSLDSASERTWTGWRGLLESGPPDARRPIRSLALAAAARGGIWSGTDRSRGRAWGGGAIARLASRLGPSHSRRKR